ncbi:nuclear transport factor 2 family protein [Streptomyces sp. 4F14]|uniref:nuclear transport factor 2 family protein n=1 Tax=Streptomyces sp. 4F14 TaxID=3394380 RepID=UPI003A84E903
MTQLVLRMQHYRDRGRFDEAAECFTADSELDLSWFTGNGAEWCAASKRMSSADGWGGQGLYHRLWPPMVRVGGDRALAEVLVAIESRISIGGVEADLISYARSQFRVQRKAGQWLIARFVSIYERDTLAATIPGTRLEIDPAEFAGHRPSHRFLAWYLSKRGIQLRPDVLGFDQPEAVARVFESDEAWLSASK